MIYFYYLEIALTDPTDTKIYAFENMSHIPAKKLIEIFSIDLEKDPNISEGYFLTREVYFNHKEYIDKNFGAINLDLFEYTLRLYVGEGSASIRSLYKEHFLE